MGALLVDKNSLIGGKIKCYRMAENLSYEDLAELVGITSEAMRAYENGIMSIPAELLAELSLVFRIPIHAFFEDFLHEDDSTHGQATLLVENFCKCSKKEQEAILTFAYELAKETDARSIAKFMRKIKRSPRKKPLNA